jgi:hypothetical protein
VTQKKKELFRATPPYASNYSLATRKSASALSNAIQELLILARVSLSRGVAGKVYLSIQLSPGGKMGKCAMIIALVAGLSNSAFARDDGR